ncbi:hypothetical protein JCM16303_003903 [Sporobolomyces ruberrimus]
MDDLLDFPIECGPACAPPSPAKAKLDDLANPPFPPPRPYSTWISFRNASSTSCAERDVYQGASEGRERGIDSGPVTSGVPERGLHERGVSTAEPDQMLEYAWTSELGRGSDVDTSSSSSSPHRISSSISPSRHPSRFYDVTVDSIARPDPKPHPLRRTVSKEVEMLGFSRVPSPAFDSDAEDPISSPTARLGRNLPAGKTITLRSGYQRGTPSDPSVEPRSPDLLYHQSFSSDPASCLVSSCQGPPNATWSPVNDKAGPSLARSSSPTQEEMDAFFGFATTNEPERVSLTTPVLNASQQHCKRDLVLGPQSSSSQSPSSSRPLPASFPPLPSPPTSSSPLPKTKIRTSIAPDLPCPSSLPRAKRRMVAQPDAIALPPIDPDLLLGSSEKRLAIIASLQRMTLAVLERLAANVRALSLPKPPEIPSRNNVNVRSREEELQERPTASLCIELTKRGARPAQDDEGQVNHEEATLDASNQKQKIVFPRRLGKGSEARLGGRDLACFMRVLELVLDGLVDNVVSTKRDLYYRDVGLFCKQQTVDAIVEDLAATLKIRRIELNVVATSKGLFSGCLRLCLVDGTEKSGSIEGTLIPPTQNMEHLVASEVAWILVVEKDAVFQALSMAQSASITPQVGTGVLITGKGYPDVSTRELVKRLATELASVPIMFLVDADPYGIDIMSTFVLGSSALSHDSTNLAIGPKRATWIGLKPSKLRTAFIGQDDTVLLTPRDRRKALLMVKREWLPSEWRRELEHLLHLNRKAEIEILASTAPSLDLLRADSVELGGSCAVRCSSLVKFVVNEIRRTLSGLSQEVPNET